MAKPGMGEEYSPDWAGFPPQMSANDGVIWARFRDIAPERYQTLYFSVLVGDPTMWTENLEEEMIRVVEHASRRRIDVVGKTEKEWHIIELRMNAGPGALGSVLTYKVLWEADPPDKAPAIPIIITDVTDRNLAFACQKLGIQLILV